MRFAMDHVKARRGYRRVLLLAETAPPSVGPDVQCSTEFAKHLSQYGWLPTIWTAEDVDELARDPGRGRLDPIREEWASDTAAVPRVTGSGVLAMRRSLRGFVNARAGEGLTAVASRFARASDERLEARQSASTQPDDGVTLSRSRLDALSGQIRSERFDVIYSTDGDGATHRLAMELKRRTSLPWVADFRDTWPDDTRYREPFVSQPPSADLHSGKPLCHSAQRQPDREILEAADVIITGSDRRRRMLADRVPSQPDKVLTIADGFNPCDSAGLQSYSSNVALQLASVFVRLVDRATETVDDSLATCQP